MKKQGIFLVIIGALSIIAIILTYNIGKFQYERDHLSFWNLAEKASTIQQKAMYMDKFVASFQNKGFEGEYNAIIFKTQDNSFDKNYEALQSLKKRLDEIQKMNIASFEYQTAIQQITQQEQGEAHNLLDELSGVWWKRNYIFNWEWICAAIVITSLLFITAGSIKLGGGWKKVNEAMKEASRREEMRGRI
jgi:hypothetical protein